jgi:hypothetical protein
MIVSSCRFWSVLAGRSRKLFKLVRHAIDKKKPQATRSFRASKKRNVPGSLVLALSGLAFLSGCSLTTSAISDLAYGRVEEQSIQLHTAQIVSAHPPYKIQWTTKLHTSEKSENYKQPLVTISTGRYRNWSWEIQATSSVAASWRIWLAHGAHQADGAVLDWKHGFKRLWNISDYLLGTKPLPMQLTLILLPNNHPYEKTVTAHNGNAVPIKFWAWYPTQESTAASVAQKRFHYYAESLALVGGLLQKVELANNVTAAPESTKGREIKNRVNSVCWLIAGRPAIAAGTDFQLKKLKNAIKPDKAGATARLAAEMYKQHPKTALAKKVYALVLATNETGRYFETQGLNIPTNGKDFNGINAMLGFCRALIHYPGDLRKEHLPLELIRPTHLFPLNASKTVRAEPGAGNSRVDKTE